MKLFIVEDSSGTVLRAVAESEPDTVRVISLGHAVSGQLSMQCAAVSDIIATPADSFQGRASNRRGAPCQPPTPEKQTFTQPALAL
jgi:hypothetical protein